MGYTLSFHNGSRCSLEHNRRNPEVVSKENHINPTGNYEIWKDTKLFNAYDDIFGESLNEYNDKIKQKHPERVQTMKQYLNSLFCKKDKSKNSKKPIYECIVQIGSRDNHPDPEVSKDILKEYYQEWERQNPNLHIVGCYYHADEEGGAHIHISYIPFAESKRGMKIQPSLTKALHSMGYEDTNINHTAQMQWQQKQRQIITQKCNEHGLDIEDVVGGKPHLETSLFKMNKMLIELTEQNKVQEERNKRLQEIENRLSTDEVQEVERLYNEEYEYIKLKKFVATFLNYIKNVFISLPVPVQNSIKRIIDSFYGENLNKGNEI